MSLNNKTKGSVLFVFYFIVGLTLLAVAGYYIGINEQSRLFKTITDKKQQQEDNVLNGVVVGQGNNSSSIADKNDIPMKSLIDSPSIVLRNIRNANTVNQDKNTSSNNLGGVKVSYGLGVDQNSIEVDKMLNIAKQAEYFVKTNENKNGINVTLLNGEAIGSNCYNEQTGKVCFPQYKLEKIWSTGDLNDDGINDSILSVSATESVMAEKVNTNNFYAMISSSSSAAKIASTTSTASTASTTPKTLTASTTSSTSISTLYDFVPFNYGLYSPTILSVEITEGDAVLIGNFYVKGDLLGKPSVNKVIKYKFNKGLIQKVSEAKLFKEQGESTSNWYPYNYSYSGLNFYFRTPDTWQREENFDDDVKIVFKTTDVRDLILQTRSIIETCSEYNFNLGDSTNVKVKSSEFIDLGQFGVGSYVKYTIINNDLNQYHADICVTDRNNDKKVFSLYSTSKEDGDPYFSIFDKIWSTFKVNQNGSSY